MSTDSADRRSAEAPVTRPEQIENVQKRSLADALQNPYVAGAIVNAGTAAAGAAYNKIKDVVQQPPGKHEKE